MVFIITLITLVGLALFFFIKRRNFEKVWDWKEWEKPTSFYSLNEGNQTDLLLFAEVSSEWLDTVNENFPWEKFEIYDNRFGEYMSILFDEVVWKSGIKDERELWTKLNYHQKIFGVFLASDGDIDNGGVDQFIFNRPEFMVVVIDLWRLLEMENLITDYLDVLKEFSKKWPDFEDVVTQFGITPSGKGVKFPTLFPWDGSLKSSEKIEEYYYEEEFKKELYQKISDFIEKNFDKFTKIIE